MTTVKEWVLNVVKKYLSGIDPYERFEFFNEIEEGYCRDCGTDEDGKGMPCQCWNDE